MNKQQQELVELGAEEMMQVSGGGDPTWNPIDTGGADAVVQWFMDKLSSPMAQTAQPY
jgi:hypothetical protein